MEEIYISTSIEDTQSIAAKLVKKLSSSIPICLWGDLAAGKTTFTQGIGKELGINRLISPTFIIMREYPVIGHSFIKNLHHLDLYRLETQEDIKAFDIEEIIADPSNLVIIEWPEKMGNLLPQKRIDVYLKSTSEDEREIKIFHH
jgi:tRNA threonylcarbamoyladenosine biosynthesis protein TsaE